jgi:SAM-dependent methyltransferase
VLEAMASGAAVVVANSPGLGRVVQHGLTGLVMPPEPEAFSRAFGGLMHDAAWRDALGTAARQSVSEQFGLERVLDLEIQAHRAALELNGARWSTPLAPVRFDPELLTGEVEEVAEQWVRALSGFARRLDPRRRARFLMAIDGPLYRMQGEAAVEANGGLHPKHRLMRYHDFFVRRIGPGQRVLDLGCGVGALAASIVSRSGAEVIGMDWSQDNLRLARNQTPTRQPPAPGLQPPASALSTHHSALEFIHGDITSDRADGRFDVLVLSNVLEHIADRPRYLRQWLRWYQPSRVLIRVPAFDREWRAPWKKELGVEWRLDETHETEYTLDQLESELREGGLRIVEAITRWGEYWVAAEPEPPHAAAAPAA